MPDYARLDRSILQEMLFYPRRDHSDPPPGAFDFPVSVDEQIYITCRFYVGGQDWPWIIYFHGNGEVASDYDYIAPFYISKSLNLVVADYRGYGASNGMPGFGHLIADAHTLYSILNAEIKSRNPAARIFIMGRSLGSTSALELAANYQEAISGLIIESGFASVTRLIKHLHMPASGIDLQTLEQQCLESIAGINCPSLIIHGEYDNLVPLPEGQLIFQTLPEPDKIFVLIPQAGHNDIIFARPDIYFNSIADFVRMGQY